MIAGKGKDLMCLMEGLTRKYSYKERPRLEGPEDATKEFEYIRKLDKEVLVMLCLTSKRTLIRKDVITIGGLNTNSVHPREVFKVPIICSAAAIIMGHNHPSGDPTPSGEDIRMTKAVSEAAKMLGIELLDHMVMGHDSQTSLRQEGLI